MKSAQPQQASAVLAKLPAEVRSAIGSVPKKIESFVGKVEGTNAYIGVVDLDGTIEAFVSDGTAATWLTGSAARNRLTAKADDGGTLAAVREGNALVGTVTFARASRKFAAAAASYPADLWEAIEMNKGELVVASWVMLPDGTQRGAGRIGNRVVQIGTLEPSGSPQVLSMGGTGAVPVPVQKTVGTKFSQSCAGLEQTWDILMAVCNNPNATTEQRTQAGNKAAAIYRKAMWNDCSWAPNPSDQTM